MVEFRISGIKKATAKGRVYYYDRVTGKRITAPFGSAAFVAEVEALRAGEPEDTPPPRDGTFGGLVRAYKASPEFHGLADTTRKDYNRVFDYLKPLDAQPLVVFDSEFVLQVRDKAFAKHKWRFANYVRQVLHLLFNWAIPRGWTASNPVSAIERIRRPKDMPRRNRAWTAAEQAAVLDAAPPELKLPIAIGLYTGLREGDVLTLPWSAYDGHALTVVQAKTAEPLEIPVHRDLKPLLDAAFKTKTATVIVTGKRGRPYTKNGFRARFFKLVRQLHAAGRIGPGLTFHGTRHTVGTFLADAGADEYTIMVVLGHRSPDMARRYTRDANRKKRAAAGIELLESARRPRPKKTD